MHQQGVQNLPTDGSSAQPSIIGRDRRSSVSTRRIQHIRARRSATARAQETKGSRRNASPSGERHLAEGRLFIREQVVVGSEADANEEASTPNPGTPGAGLAGTLSISLWAGRFLETDEQSETTTTVQSEQADPLSQPGAYRMAGINGGGLDDETTVTDTIADATVQPTMRNSDSETTLVHAEVVEQTEDADVKPAEVFEAHELGEPSSGFRDMSIRRKVIVVGIVLLGIAGLVVGLVLGLGGSDGSAAVEVVQLVTSSPTLAPSSAPASTPLVWTQVGDDLIGEVDYDGFGNSIAMSADGNVIAVGAPWNDYNDTTISNRGSVHVFIRNGTSWNQLGGFIHGENEDDRFGDSVALSSDGTMLAVGAPYNGDNREYSGQVRMFRLVNDEWSQVGSNLNGENEFDQFGTSVALSADGNVLAVGAHSSVHVYIRNEALRSLLGAVIRGENEFDGFGTSVALSADGTILAVGAPYNDDNGISSGQVRIFRLVNNDWIQVGSSLNGENAGDRFGNSVALSADGTVLAVGAPYNDDNGDFSGQVCIFQLVNDDWAQVGSSLNGENAGDWFGVSVASSSDGTVLAVGAHGNDGNGISSGHMRFFQLVNDDWAQVGSAINGKGKDDYFGSSVALSADGTTVAGGAPQRFNGGPGYVMVYHLEEEDE